MRLRNSSGGIAAVTAPAIDHEDEADQLLAVRAREAERRGAPRAVELALPERVVAAEAADRLVVHHEPSYGTGAVAARPLASRGRRDR